MNRTFGEGDAIRVELLITPDMYPMPASMVIHKHLGNDHVLLTSEDGAVEKVIQGEHMIIDSLAGEFAMWAKDKTIWMFDPDKGKFQRAFNGEVTCESTL